jgi:hypothetical protein
LKSSLRLLAQCALDPDATVLKVSRAETSEVSR